MPIRLDIAFLVSGCAAMMSILWYNLQEQKENEQRKSAAEKLAKDAELYKLQQQLQPHFLFNSLNSVSALAGTQPELARKMIHQLSDFLRGTLKKDDHQWVTLKEELQHLQLYLDIEKVRFSHRLHTEITVDEESTTCKLPAMLLQPIVENAIKFGLYDTIETITIRVKAVSLNNYLVITVENPFDNDTSPTGGTGFGLTSIRRRLYLLFARNDLLETNSTANIFTTTVKLPQK
jgi:LytS/YehU family sensor histidine kinase